MNTLTNLAFMKAVKDSSIVTEGLVMYFDFGNPECYLPSVSSMNDLSKNNNIATLAGGIPTYTTQNGGGFVFNGSDTYINTPLNVDANPNTIEAWFYPYDVSSGNGRGVALSDDGGWDKGFGMVSSVWEIHTGNAQAKSATYAPQINTWYHGCLIYTSTSINFYVDTISVYAAGAPGATSGSTLNIGRAYYNAGAGSRWFSGIISIVKCYNRALSYAEVVQNFNANKNRYGK